MRICVGCLIVATASFGLAPSSAELHSRYGLSDLERFTVRPGITATVQYGADHLACQIQIEPYQSLVHQDVQPPHVPTVMPLKDVSEILEELAPVAMRGKESGQTSFQASCGGEEIDEYENVLILRGILACAPAGADHDIGVSIVFKRDICPKVKSPVRVEPNTK
ncbi:MAG TPA: hypothetical protein VHN10_11410 [Candidatus Acidoferrales bacterium]|jgi:hypothetical protein|nr:hypothetical protein [Candidatus Acidoferrales bacterium]